MTDNDKAFTGSIPEFYDRYLVPMIFAEYADDLAKRAAAFAPSSILETAAGSGVVTRALTARLDPTVRYVATDLNQPMLDHAARLQDDGYDILWQQADALDLPFDDNAFEVVICQFGVMFFPDKIAGYAEARRVLRPGGHFLFSVWDHIGVNEFAEEVTRAAVSVFPDDPPLFMERIPHGYNNLELVREHLTAVGFKHLDTTTLAKTSRAPSARHVARAYCEGTPMRNEITARDSDRLDAVTDLAARAIARRFGDGSVAGKIQAHVVSAVA